MRYGKAAALAIVGFCLAPQASQASVLVSNIGEPVRGTTIVDNSLWAAQSFINSGSSSSLDNIRTVLGSQTGTPALTAQLRKGTTSGALLTSFVVPSLIGAQLAQTLTPLSAVMLDPGETYWLILGVNGPGSFGWSYAEGNDQSGPGALGNYGYSVDQGATWGSFGSDNPYLMEVNVSAIAAVPEPASWFLMIAGFGFAGAAMRKRPRARVVAA